MNRLNLQFLRDAARLIRPYWVSEERYRAWALLAAIIGLTLFQVYLSVLLNQWQGSFYDAIQQYNWDEVVQQIGIFMLIAAALIVDAVYSLYLTQLLGIRWRRWMTVNLLNSWLNQQAYYHLQRQGDDTDNPDQRIAEDLRLFTDQVLDLGVGLLNSVVTLISFLIILWDLSGPVTVPLGHGHGIYIPGYAVWIALIYAVLGTVITLRIGRPLVGLYITQQRREADFRFSMIRLRENADSIAFLSGEALEGRIFQARFGAVLDNFVDIMLRRKKLTWFSASYDQLAVLVPYFIALPRYFSHAIELGGLQRFVDAFSQVQGALSYLIESYRSIAELQSVVTRLTGFQQRLDSLHSADPGSDNAGAPDQPPGITLTDVTLFLPDGGVLQDKIGFSIHPGQRLLVMGPSGAGKTILLRAIAGLWPEHSGTIRRGFTRPLFLPQRPYLPLGTLRECILYPHGPYAGPDEGRFDAALAATGLQSFGPWLDISDNWAARLSPGEQQRLNFARLLLQAPDAIFLDEASSALDEATEAQLYHLLTELPGHPIILSIGHRSTLIRFHTDVFTLPPPQSLIQTPENPA